MIIETTEFTLKDGRKAILRSPREEDIPGVLEYLYITSGETEFLLWKAELFCDFSCSGYRILGDLICDADDMNRKNDITKHIVRKGDGSDIRSLLAGVRLHGNYEEILSKDSSTEPAII